MEWKLSGIDGRHFNLGVDDGEAFVRFDDAPDYENPHDYGGTNTYKISLNAVDNGTPPKGKRLSVNIRVRDVNEAPVAIGEIADIALGVDETATSTDFDGLFSDPDTRDTLVYSVVVDPPEVAMATLSDTTLTLTRDSGGEAVVTLSAHDRYTNSPDVLSAHISFGLSIAVPKPEVSSPDLTLSMSQGSSDTQMVRIVRPGEETRVTMSLGNVQLSLSALSENVTYQVMLDMDPANCDDGTAPGEEVHLCLTAQMFDENGGLLRNVVFDQPATLVFRLDRAFVDGAGGADILMELHAAGGLTLWTREAPGDGWREVSTSLSINDDGSATLVSDDLRHFSSFAVIVRREMLTRMNGQSEESSPTTVPQPQPTPTESPVPASPTPVSRQETAPSSTVPQPTPTAAAARAPARLPLSMQSPVPTPRAARTTRPSPTPTPQPVVRRPATPIPATPPPATLRLTPEPAPTIDPGVRLPVSMTNAVPPTDSAGGRQGQPAQEDEGGILGAIVWVLALIALAAVAAYFGNHYFQKLRQGRA